MTYSLGKLTWDHIHVDRVFEKSHLVLIHCTINFSLDRRKVEIVVGADFALLLGVDLQKRCYIFVEE